MPEGAAVEPATEPFALSAPYDPPELDASLLAMSGLEQLRASIRGETRPAPISELLGMRPIEADEGSAAFAMPVSGWLAGEGGRPQAGVLAPLADAAHAAAVVTTLPPGNALTTLCLTLSYAGALDDRAEEVVCRARCDRGGAGELPSHSSAEVTDDRGTVLARSTARCAVFPLPGVPAADGIAGDRTGRPAPRGAAAVPAAGPDASGDPPIRELTGLRALEAGDGDARFELPATIWVASLLRQVQGGALALLAEAALDGAVASALPAPGARETVELRVDFLRRAPAGEGPLQADATLTQRGRNFAFGSCTVSSADRGRVAAATSVHRY
jgi:uncharacterized protein (TIGR00369 family)